MSLDTLSAMRRALEAGETTAVALTEQALAAAEAKADLNAFLHLDPTQARAAAEAADARRQAGEGTALTGIPLAVKDIFCSEGDPTTAASKMLANWRAPYDATAVARLKGAGAVLLGAATSLSGSVLSVTAAYRGHPELAVSNALGGIAVQTFFLAIADMVYRRANLEHAAASAPNMMQNGLLIALLALLLLAPTLPSLSRLWTEFLVL